MTERQALTVLMQINEQIWESMHPFMADTPYGRERLTPQLVAGGAVRKVSFGHYTVLTQNPTKTSTWARAAREQGINILWLLDDSIQSSNNYIYMLYVDKVGATLRQFDQDKRTWQVIDPVILEPEA